MKESNYITDLLICALVYVLIFALSIFIPLFIIIGILLLPIPIITYTSKHSIQKGLVLVLIVSLTSYFIGSYITLLITIFVCFGGLLVGDRIHKQAGAYETWLYGTVGYTLGLVFAYAGSDLLLQINWLDSLRVAMDESIETFTMMMNQFGMQSEMESQIELLEEQVTQLAYSFAAFLFIIGMFFGLTTQWLAYKWLNWKEKTVYFFPPFRTFNFPIILIWIHLIAIILQYTNMEVGSSTYIAVVSVLTITSLCLVIQGYSFIFFFAHYKQFHKVIPIIVTIITILLAPLFLIIIQFIGIIDIGFRWKRHLLKKK